MLLTLAVLALAVFAIAAVYSNLGLGGGFMYVPALVLVASLDGDTAVPVSLVLVLSTSLAAVYQHNKAGNVDFRLAATLSGGACLGAVGGALFNLAIGEVLFRYLFLAMTLVICAWIAIDLYRAIRPDANDDTRMCATYLAPAVALAALAGFLSGAFGIGGGAIMVPVLMYLLCRRVKLAVGTSSATIIPTAVTGLAMYFIGGGANLDADWHVYALVLAPLAFAGGFLGTRAGIAKLSAWQIKAVFLGLTVLVAAAMVLSILV